MDLSLFFVGTGGSTPSAQRGLPATLLRRGAEHLLFDCGEGTQRQLVRSVGLADLDCVFITHFHADHWLGLPGMLKSFALRGREQPLTIYGPPGLADLMGSVRFIYGRLPYELSITELAPAESVRRGDYTITTVPVRHRTRVAYGYVFSEDPRPGHLDPKLAEQLGVKPGPDFGRLQRGEAVAGVDPSQVMGPERQGRKIALSGDTAPSEAMRVAAHNADVLVHEATFLDADSERATETMHSTALQAAKTAADAEVGMLAITHISGRYAIREVRDQARGVFARTVAPRDFDTIEVPFAERGVPMLTAWKSNPARSSTPGGSGSSAGGTGASADGGRRSAGGTGASADGGGPSAGGTRASTQTTRAQASDSAHLGEGVEPVAISSVPDA